MKKTIQFGRRKATARDGCRSSREQVAELIYDWIHEAQVTHRKTWAQRTEKEKAQYRQVAASIAAIYEAAANSALKDSEGEENHG